MDKVSDLHGFCLQTLVHRTISYCQIKYNLSFYFSHNIMSPWQHTGGSGGGQTRPPPLGPVLVMLKIRWPPTKSIWGQCHHVHSNLLAAQILKRSLWEQNHVDWIQFWTTIVCAPVSNIIFSILKVADIRDLYFSHYSYLIREHSCHKLNCH